jgi:hypothetical protein
MEGLYQQPFSTFERYGPAGGPDAVAGALAPYLEAGIEDIVLLAVGADDRALVDLVAEVRELLVARAAG